jgi:alkyl sulfatase BDS1-like metallo-beta-lactamase superfamily hydrolase
MHHWPVWGNDTVVKHLQTQRDTYRYINDQTLRLLNHGYTMVEIAEMFELPDDIATSWSGRGYYGSVNHDVKATYVLYLGWFDGNPATLHELPPTEASTRYVEFMGGSSAVIARAREDYDKGDYRWVAQVMNHVVFAEPTNAEGRALQADALEQLGYQAESGPWRNFYLSGAQELRKGVAPLPTPNTASPDTIRAMNIDLLFDYFGMRLNGPKAAGKKITVNWNLTDTGEKVLVTMENGVLNHTIGRQASDADTTVTLKRTTLNAVLLKQTTFKKEIAAGRIKISGSTGKFNQMMSYLDDFEFWFNIVTP